MKAFLGIVELVLALLVMLGVLLQTPKASGLGGTIGGGGTIAATEGKDVDLPVGTVLRVRLDSPLDLR